MSGIAYFGFIIAIAVATYVQSVTGFAFGLIFVGMMGLSNLIPLNEAAVIVSLMTISNAVVILCQGWRSVSLRYWCYTIIGAFPAVIAAYFFLLYMAGRSFALVEIILGLVIIFASFQLIRRPEPLKQLSSNRLFIIFGFFGGILSGLFSTAGPPIVYQFYRQPLSHPVIRETLIAIFAATSIIRLSTVMIKGDWTWQELWLSLIAFPVVVVVTLFVRRFPPRFNPMTMRRIVFILLFLSGASLAVPALFAL